MAESREQKDLAWRGPLAAVLRAIARFLNATSDRLEAGKTPLVVPVALVALAIVNLFWVFGLFSAPSEVARAPAEPEIAEEIAAPSPEAIAEAPTPAPTIAEPEPAAEIAPAEPSTLEPLEPFEPSESIEETLLTPEQYLIASIREQVTAIADRISEGSIASVRADFDRGILTLGLEDTWFELPSDRQDSLANAMLAESKKLDFRRFLLVDGRGDTIARNPIVGNEAIFLKRSL